MSVVRSHGRSVADDRRLRGLVIRTTRMSAATMRRSRRLAPRVHPGASSAVPLQHCARIAAEEITAIGITSLALGVSPAPVSPADEDPICDRIMIPRRRGANRGRRFPTKEGKLIRPSPGVRKDKNCVLSQPRRVADRRR